MTDLERVRDVFKGEEMCDNCVTPWKCNGPHEPPDYIAIIDAHLKEDAERHEAAMLFAEQRDKVNAELAELKKDYIRLREAVRRWYVNALPEVSEADLDRLRQLIKEKE